MQPHCHPGDEKIENMYLIEGSFALIIFNDKGVVVDSIILEKGKKGEVYNVCSSKGTSIGEILQLLQSNSEKKIKVIIDENKVRKNEALAIVGDNSKIKRELGWTPKYDLEKTILDMLDYWRERV